MSEPPPSVNRPTCEEVTMVDPNANVSGSTSVACWLGVFVNGSVETLSRPPPPAGFTVSEYAAVWDVDPEVPVIVIGKVPVGVVLTVVRVSVELLPTVTDVGLKVAVAPAGRPAAVRGMVPVKPPLAAVETVVAVEPPTVTEPEVGVSAMLKWGGLLLRVTSSYLVWVGSPA